jgi:hypothetical protein
MDSFEWIPVGSAVWDETDDNIDVVVTLASGEGFTGTLITIQNLASLMKRYENTGECESGLYVWASHSVVVKDLTITTINRVVSSLVLSGELSSAFLRV